MKELFILGITACIIISCKPDKQSEANKSAENYIRERLDDPASLESISFSPLKKYRRPTSLDSIMWAEYAMMGKDTTNSLDFENRYVDSVIKTDRDQGSILLQNAKDIRDGKLEHYWLEYTFRIKDKGQKKLKKYSFELDSLNNIVDVSDITDEVKIVQ